MAGHSHWTQIKRQKGSADAKKGSLFTKLARALIVAARDGGGDPDQNEKLRLAIERARVANMPKDSIDRAIKRGTGELADGESIEEVMYEGFGPGGAAVLVQTMTNNRNRTTAELRNIFNKYGGSLGTQNSVNWMFKTQGQIISILPNQNAKDSVMLAAIDAGAEDVEVVGDNLIATTDPKKVSVVAQALATAGLTIKETTIEPVPATPFPIDAEHLQRLTDFFGDLEELEDVNNFFTNAQSN